MQGVILGFPHSTGQGTGGSALPLCIVNYIDFDDATAAGTLVRDPDSIEATSKRNGKQVCLVITSSIDRMTILSIQPLLPLTLFLPTQIKVTQDFFEYNLD